MRTYEELKTVIKKKGYLFFTGDYDVNIIFERCSDNFTNRFDDWMHVCYQANGKNTVLSIPATTKAGLYGGHAVKNPKTVAGLTGVAVLVPGQYRKSHKFLDESSIKGRSYPWNYPYFSQVAPVRVWRDWDKDEVVDKVQPQQGVFGINIHVMSQKGIQGKDVNNWSEGCCGAEEPSYRQILPVIRKSVELYGDLFTLTLIESKDFK